MTSALSKEDLRSALYSAGVKNPRKLDEMMRLIRVFALQEARKAVPLEDAAPVAELVLLPGECDMERDVSCCLSCEKVKDWKCFHIDQGNPPSKRRKRCKSCLRESKPAQSYKCRGCGMPRKLHEFPPGKAENTSAPMHCNECQGI